MQHVATTCGCHQHKRNTSYSMRALAAILLAIAASLTQAQRICSITGAPAPSVVTLVASSDASAFLVFPDCTYKTKAYDDMGFFGGVERIESIPSKIIGITLFSCPLSAGFDLSAATGTISIIISAASATAFQNSKFPRSVDVIQITGTPLDSLATTTMPLNANQLYVVNEASPHSVPLGSLTSTHRSVQGARLTSIDFPVPPRLTTISLNSNPITTLTQANIPPALQTFLCTDCQLTSIAGLTWPKTLTKLELSGNPISELDQIRLPSQLQHFTCERCKLTLIRGVRLPSTLSTLLLAGNQIEEFEVEASDTTVLERLSGFSFDPTAARGECSDQTAQRRRVGPFQVCVITAERFSERYVQEPSDSQDGSLGRNSSTSISSSASVSSDSSRGSDTAGNNGYGVGSNALSSGSFDGIRENSMDDSEGSSDSNQSPLPSDTSSITVVIAVVIAVGICVSLALVGFYILAKHRQSRDRDEHKFEVLATPVNGSSDMKTTPCTGSEDNSQRLKDDIRWDPNFAQLFIEPDALEIDRLIARGGFGVIYKAKHNKEVVAIKRLAPDAWRDDAKLNAFMGEIRMCATLHHPKIVTFIGVAWSSLRDITVVIEYMGGGDLCALLEKQPTPPSPQDWFQPWTATKTVKSKASLALDVVDAVVYLHSFSSPILHRDLKARNVLLDAEGNAKLSDFGISRELSLDATMTSEVGTVAWIAPEVLRGDRYSEKADIYSLGVLLVELDRCRHPYADTLESNGTDPVARPMTNTQIAVAVVADKLRPSAAASSSTFLKDLVAACVSYDAVNRPTAMEIHFALRQKDRADRDGVEFNE